LRQAARDLNERWGCAVLVKGGHLRGAREAVDYFCDGRVEMLFSAPFLRGPRTHGTGCAYSAAIASFLAKDCALPDSIRQAKDFLTRAIKQSQRIGRGHVLGFGPPKHPA
jgi:hydroxymethylpyrimidine kinase/phosphomethylpyrimidine kinase